MDEIENSAYEYTKSIDDDERVIVGLNKFTIDNEPRARCLPDRPDARTGAAAAPRRVQGEPRRRSALGPARRRPNRGTGERQSALPDEGGAACRRDPRRGQRRAARRVRHVPTLSPPTLSPPTLSPPTLSPPTLSPPTLSPPTLSPPTLSPPTLSPPTLSPPTLSPPTLSPPTLSPPTLSPPTLSPPGSGVIDRRSRVTGP